MSGLRETFEKFWTQIRGSQIYGGQPRNADTAAALSLAQEALRLATDAQDEELLPEAWAMMAYTLNANEQWGDSLPYYERAIQKHELRGDSLPVARLRIGYVAALIHLGRYDEALKTAAIAEEEFKKTGDQFRLARLYINVANAYHRLDQHQKSFDYFITAANTFEALGDRDNAACVYHGLGNALARVDRFEEAEEMFKRTCQTALELGIHDYEEAKALAFYGVALLQMRRYAEALETFRDAQQGFEREKNEYWIAALDLYRADVHLALGRYWEAHSLATQAKNRFEALGIPSRRMLSLVLLGRVALAQNDLAAAARYTGEIEVITKNASVPLLLFPYHLLSGQSAEANKDWTAAKTAYELAAQDLEMH